MDNRDQALKALLALRFTKKKAAYDQIRLLEYENGKHTMKCASGVSWSDKGTYICTNKTCTIQWRVRMRSESKKKFWVVFINDGRHISCKPSGKRFMTVKHVASLPGVVAQLATQPNRIQSDKVRCCAIKAAAKVEGHTLSGSDIARIKRQNTDAITAEAWKEYGQISWAMGEIVTLNPHSKAYLQIVNNETKVVTEIAYRYDFTLNKLVTSNPLPVSPAPLYSMKSAFVIPGWSFDIANLSRSAVFADCARMFILEDETKQTSFLFTTQLASELISLVFGLWSAPESPELWTYAREVSCWRCVCRV
jgi:hypothetical protein